MKRKQITRISTKILMTLMVVVMLFTVASSALRPAVSADSSIFKKNDSIYTDYTKYLDSSVVRALPDTIADDEIISVIVKLDEPSIMAAYNETDKSMSIGEFAQTDEAKRIKDNIARAKEEYLKALTRNSVSYTTGADYSTVLSGFEVLFEAKHFSVACSVLGKGATAIVGEVYNKAETQLVENNVSVYEDTGIFDSSSFKYDGSGMVVAVLDTGLDYTHPAFDPAALTSTRYGLTKSEVASVISGTVASSMVSGLTADDVYINEKVPFAFDYADGDSDVYSLHNNHGTHVSGVIVGNDDVITGVAPNAQLVSMKIFSDTMDTARASWILAALEDCVELGVDVINMSLGTACGFSRETDQEQMSGVYDDIRSLGISLVVAASNSFNSAYGSEKNGNLGLTSNPDTSTVGSPSTYDGAMSVASINGTKTPYILYNGRIIYFLEASDSAGEEKHFFDDLLTDGQTEIELEYVLIPGVGTPSNYSGVDVAGKVALVRRGSNTFEEKAKAAQDAGARAIIVYNNTSGEIRMNAGITSIPICSISQDDGEALAAAKTGTIKISRSQSSGPFMSDFSSWGPSPSLQIKPEITAHGGNILSAVTGHGYDRLSGTSMACPNMAGVIALMRQYVIDEFASKITDENGNIDYVEVNAIVNRLLMSTADIVYNKNGLEYAVRKQGAGLANIADASTTQAYILTYDRLDGSVMDKSKIELGDDPDKTGVYVLKFTIDNFGNSDLSYNISASVMTEGVSETPTYKGDTVVTEEGYLLSGATCELTSTNGGTLVGKTLTVGANSKCDVVVTVRLSEQDKAYLDSSFANGMYVEGFVVLDAVDEGSTDLNVPYLAFYGNWYQAPLFDLDYFETDADEQNDSIALLDKTLADAYATRPIGGISEDYVSYLGSYYFVQNPQNKIISANRDYIALSNTEGTIHSLRFVWGGLLRNAEHIDITITNDATGEVIFSKTEYSIRKSYGDGGSYIYPANIEIEFDVAEYNLPNNSTFTVKLVGHLDYGNGGDGQNLKNTFEFPLTIDFEAPALTDCEFYTEYDKEAKRTRLFTKMAVYDNHYAMGMQIGYVGTGYDTDPTTGELTAVNMLYPFENYMTPIYSVKNGTTYVIYELTDHIFDIKQNSYNKNTFAISLYDYAINEATYEIQLPDEFAELYLEESEITLNPNEVYTISTNVYPEQSWDELLQYSASGSAVRIVNNKIVAVKPGVSRVFIYDPESGKEASMKVTVRGEKDEGYKEVSKPVADVFKLTGYETLKAFYLMSNDDRDIGEEGDVSLFTGENYNLSMYPSESVRINYKLDAYFPDATSVEFSTGNESIATVTEDGVITAMNEGYTAITVKVLLDGKSTYYSKTISISVKDPYARTGPTLNNYYGTGTMNSGVVEIPEDMLFTQIGQYAFSNYMYISKDLENGDVINDDDPDATKITFIGNDDITKVVIPEGIKTIGPYAFANLTALKEVVLPSTLEAIEYGAFYNCTSLTKVTGLEHVKIINKYAFQYCNIQNDLSLDSIHAVGDYAFAYNRNLKSIEFAETLSSIGAYAFAGNRSLTEFKTAEGDNIKYGMYVFMDCSSLEEITMNTNVIPSGSFYNCRNLTTVNIGATVANIGEYAFAGTNINEFNVAEDNTVYSTSTGRDYLLSKDGKTLLLVAPGANGRFTLTGVNTIGYGAFAGNSSITSVYMPDVTHVGNYAFSECRGLKSITLGKLDYIGSYSFFLTDITELPEFSDSITEIGSYAFAFTLIDNIVIKDRMTVGEGAFTECAKITSVVIGKNVTISTSAFLRGAMTIDPRNHNAYLNIKSTPSRDMQTGYYYYEYTSDLRTLVIGENAVIGDYAFMGAANLMSIQLDRGATIGEMAFYNCTKLYSIDLSGVKKIGKMAFSGDNRVAYTDKECQSPAVENMSYVFYFYTPIIESVNLTSLEKDGLGEQAFIYCKKLKSVKLGANTEVIPYMAFANCDSLTTVNLENVKKVEYAAFAETDIKSANLQSATVIGDYAFTKCEDLDNVIFSIYGVSVGEGAFSYCSSLTNTKHFEDIKHIGAYAFAYTDIRSANLLSAITVGDAAFIKEELTDYVFTVTLGEKLTSLGDNPFAYCRINPMYVNEDIIFGDKVIGKRAVYTYDVNDYIKIIDGSIYCVVPNGLELTTYIALDENGKSLDSGKAFVVDGTVRISAMAFVGADLTKVTLPHSLKAIGHKAFYQCDKLSLIVFQSYDAPILEEEFDQNLYDSFKNIPCVGEYEITYNMDTDGDGALDQVTYTYNGLEIIPYYMWNISSTKYNNIYYGANFVDYIGYVTDETRNYHNMGELIMVRPANARYYDSFIYLQYFNTVIDGAASADAITTAAINAINLIPTSNLTLEDEHLVIAAREAYNKIATPEQQVLVYNYNILTTAENLIAAYKNALNNGEDAPIEPTPDNTKKEIDTETLVIMIVALIAVAGATVAFGIWFFLKHNKPAYKLACDTEAEENAIATEKTVYSTESYEDSVAKFGANGTLTVIKRVAIGVALVAAVIGVVMFAITKCDGNPTPYEEYENDGYNISVKFDANGGVFTTNTSVIVDSYKLENLPDADDGRKSISVLDPANAIRGGQAYQAAKVGYNLAGWYATKTEVKDDDGNVIGYTYSDKWDFDTSKYYIKADGNYSIDKPVLTLYAAWVPDFTYEFYAVDDEGNLTLLGTKAMNPTQSTDIRLPAFNETTGGTDANDFPYISDMTYNGVYSDPQCTIPVESDVIQHHGVFDASTAQVSNTTMKIYCKMLDGLHFRISSADQLIENAYLNGVYTITNNLDFTGKHWPEVFTTGSFSGAIIGNGYAITNVTLEQNDNSVTNFGLFGQIADDARIENLKLDNITLNVKAGSRLSEPKFGIIAGLISDSASISAVRLTNSEIVIYTKSTVSMTVLKPEYGLVCGIGNTTGVDFSIGNKVEFSSFGDNETTTQESYVYTLDENGCFTLTKVE